VSSWWARLPGTPRLPGISGALLAQGRAQRGWVDGPSGSGAVCVCARASGESGLWLRSRLRVMTWFLCTGGFQGSRCCFLPGLDVVGLDILPAGQRPGCHRLLEAGASARSVESCPLAADQEAGGDPAV
jgi:hypothetical protein